MRPSFESENIISYGINVCKSDWCVLAAAYPFHRLYYVYEGDACYCSDGDIVKLKHNYTYLFPVNVPYSITHNPQNPLKCMWFDFVLNSNIINLLIEIDNENVKKIVYIISQYIENKQLCTTMLNALIGVLNYEHNFICLSSVEFDMVLEYINQNLSRTISNEKLAAIINLDKRYFIRKFKSVYGVTPQQYISGARLIRSLNYLSFDYSIEKISELVGFSDSKAFCRFFKLAKGVSPSVYKKSYSRQP